MGGRLETNRIGLVLNIALTFRVHYAIMATAGRFFHRVVTVLFHTLLLDYTVCLNQLGRTLVVLSFLHALTDCVHLAS